MACTRIQRVRTLTDLPQEILCSVASYLDSRSALHLSLTGNALRIPGESVIWREISISAKDVHPSLHLSTPLGPVLDNHQDYDADYTQYLLFRGVIRKLVHFLESCPWRGGMVEKLDIVSGEIVPMEFGTVLDRIGGRLGELHVKSLRGLDYAYPNTLKDFVPLDELFATHSTAFSSLRVVYLSMQNHSPSALSTLLNLSPGIRSLHLNYGSCAETAEEYRSMNIPLLRQLSNLVVDHPFTNAAQIEDLIARSPQIQTLALREPSVQITTRVERLIHRFGSLPNLKSLQLPVLAVPLLQEGGFESLEELDALWTAAEARRGETSAVQPFIPPLPNLRVYRLDVLSLHAAKLHQHYTSRIASRNFAKGILDSFTPENLQHIPNLTIVDLPSRLDLRSQSPTSEHKAEWKQPTFHGVLIYSFARGDREELIHLRSRISADDQCMGSGCWICPLDWQDRAWVDGVEVPVNILNAVYAASGVDLNNLEPGRGNRLEKEGWDVLDYVKTMSSLQD